MAGIVAAGGVVTERVGAGPAIGPGVATWPDAADAAVAAGAPAWPARPVTMVLATASQSAGGFGTPQRFCGFMSWMAISCPATPGGESQTRTHTPLPDKPALGHSSVTSIPTRILYEVRSLHPCRFTVAVWVNSRKGTPAPSLPERRTVVTKLIRVLRRRLAIESCPVVAGENGFLSISNCRSVRRPLLPPRVGQDKLITRRFPQQSTGCGRRCST